MTRGSYRRWSMAAVISVATMAGSNLAVHSHVGVATAIPVFMLLALLATWQAGFRYAIVVTIAATACLDYFFTEPRYGLQVNSAQDALALFSFATVSLLVSHLGRRIRTERSRLETKEHEQRDLYELSQSILLSDWKTAPEEGICRIVQDRLSLTGVAVWDDKSSKFWSAGDAREAEDSLRAALRVGRDYDLADRNEYLRVLHFGTRSVGAVLLRGGALSPLLVSSVSTLIASNFERIRALRAEVLAESVTMSEQLRTAVLDGLAHAVKTPLTTIAVSSAGLRELGGLTALQSELANTIEVQALNIAALTDRLLRTSKLSTQDVTLHRRMLNLQAVYESAIAELPVELSRSRISATFPEGAVTLDGDPEVLRMALVQLLENALKYSPDGSRVQVTVRCTDSDVRISVHNTGTYISPSEHDLVFQRYYRSPSTGHSAPGTGLGLSIAKRAVEMHDGSLNVESDPEDGTTFHLTLPGGGTC